MKKTIRTSLCSMLLAAALSTQPFLQGAAICAREQEQPFQEEGDIQPLPNPDGDFSDYSGLLSAPAENAVQSESLFEETPSSFERTEELSRSHNEQAARLLERTNRLLEAESKDSPQEDPKEDPKGDDGSDQKPVFDGSVYDNKSLYELETELDRIEKEIKDDPAKADEHKAALTSLKEHIAALETIPMFRFYNPNSGEHFYTSSVAEKNSLIKAGWKDEGIGWLAPKNGGDPVYRLYNANQGDHHYTLNANEKNSLIKAGWKDEGIGWNSYTADDPVNGLALHRQYNPNQYAWNHNFTTAVKEKSILVQTGWKDEGLAWYGIFPVSRVKDESGKIRFYDTEKRTPLSGEQTIAGDVYFLDPQADNTMSTGRKTIGGKEYYHDKDGHRLFGWQNLEDHRMHMDTNTGVILRGYWQQSRYDKYYFDDKGYMVVNTTVDVNGQKMSFGADGRKSLSPEELTQNKAYEIVNQVGRDPQKLFLWLIDTVSYKTLPIHVQTAPGWNLEQTYAMRGFEEHNGNCFVYANAYAYLLRELGYNAVSHYGKTRSVTGAILDHGWTEVEINGKWYICDGSFARSMRGMAISHCYMQDRDHPKWSYIF